MDWERSYVPWVEAKIIKVMIYKDFITSEFFPNSFRFFSAFVDVCVSRRRNLSPQMANDEIFMLIDNAKENADR